MIRRLPRSARTDPLFPYTTLFRSPLSLSLNLESNLMVRDHNFASELRAHLLRLLREDCETVDQARLPPWRPWHVLTRPLLFHCLRRFPYWAGLLPAHTPRTALLQPDPEAPRSEEHTSDLQTLMRIAYAVLSLKKKHV